MKRVKNQSVRTHRLQPDSAEQAGYAPEDFIPPDRDLQEDPGQSQPGESEDDLGQAKKSERNFSETL